MWWQELGADGARSLLAACNEPAEVAMRVNRCAATARRCWRGCARPGSRRAAPRGGWPLAAAETIVVAGRTGDAVPELVAAGELTPQSRGSAAVVEVLDPQPGEHVLDLCAGPGIKTGQIAARMGDRGEVISVELDPDRAAEVAAQAQPPRPAQRHRDRGRRGADRRWRPASTASCSTLPARTSAPSPRARTRAGASRRRRSSGWSRSRTRMLRGAAARAASRRRARLLDLHDLARARTRTGSRRCSRPPAAGEVPALELEDLGARAPGARLAADPRCLQLRPDRDRTTGFFIAA